MIKLRIVRFLRTPEYDELFAGDPTWVTESIGGMGDDGRPLVTKTSFRYPADALQPRPGAGAEPDDLVLAAPARRRSGASPPRSRSTPARIQFESDEIMRRAWGDDGAIACCVSPMLRRQADAVLRRPRQPRQVPALRDQRRPRRDQRRAGRRRRSSRSRATCLDFDDVVGKFERMMDWLAGVYVNAMNVIHYMHDKYAYERIEMALHDYAPLRTMAFGMAGLSVVADSLSAIKHAKVQRGPRRDRADHRLPDRGRVPAVRQQRQPRRPARRPGSSARS